MKGRNNIDAKKRSTRTVLLLVLVAALTLEATSLIQSYYSQKGLREEADHRADAQLDITRSMIMDVVDQTETAVGNSVWISQWCLSVLDSLQNVSERLVRDNSTVVGSTVALIPGYNRQHQLFAPYVYQEGDSLIFQSLATPEYDYPSQEWFTRPLVLNKPYWSEPYLDEGGGEVLMTTYSVPIHDRKERQAAVLTGDVALGWLTDVLKGIEIYPHASSFIISRSGRLMVGENQEQQALDLLAGLIDRITAGEEGKMIEKTSGGKFHVYYAPVEHTGWTMCVMIPDDDIYGSIRKIEGLVKLLQLLGLILLLAILHSFFRSQKRYRELDQKRALMMGELKIASDIQMSMVPKVFPPFPERHDLDMAAVIVPAREVGGDLYDFYIRDEKLFFCLGDVSGKGIPASLVMSVTRTTFRTVSAKENSPGAIVKAMNATLSDMNDLEMFVTFFCGVLDLEKGVLRYCNAGHNPPRILTDAIRVLPVDPNLPLGIIQDMVFTEQEVTFGYDSAIFLYTDGLTEAENIAHEQFGEERMDICLHGRRGAYNHLNDLEESIHAFVGDAPQSDDITMLFIHFLGGKANNQGDILYMHNDIQQVSRIEEWLGHIGNKYNLQPALIPNLNLALEEAFTNVALYAFPKGSYGSIELSASCNGNEISFVLSDRGKEFDPTNAPDADISATLEDRRIGGLGIHLVRQIMDSVSYERKDGKNILTMIINI